MEGETTSQHSVTRRSFLGTAGRAAGALTAASLVGVRIPEVAAQGALRTRATSTTPVTLTWWTNHPEWIKQVNKLAAIFQRAYPHIKLDITPKPGPSYATILEAALASNSAPNIFGFSAGGEYIQIAKGGHLHNLTGKVSLADLQTSATSVMFVGNKVYAVPLLGEYTIGMYYWKPVFQKYKLTPPKVWSDLTAISKTLLRNGEVPMMLPAADGQLPTFMYCNLLSTVRGPSGVTAVASGKAKLTDSDFLSAAAYIQSLAPYFNPGYLSTQNINGKAAFAEGQAVMLIGGSADYTGYKDTNPHVDLGFFAMPHPDGRGVSTVNSGLDNLYGLNSSVTDLATIAAGLTFFDFFLSRKAQTVVANTLELPDTTGVTVQQPILEEVVKQFHK